MRPRRASVAAGCAIALAVGCAAHGPPHEKGAERGQTRAPSCAPGLAVLDGACVDPREADAYCGAPGSSTIAAGRALCASPRCTEGDALDPARAACVPARAVRANLGRDRALSNGAVLTCHAGHTLVAHDDHVTCLATVDTCPRGAAWDPRVSACLPSPECPTGAVRDGSRCARFAEGDGAGRAIDVATWARAVLGADGGEGGPLLCRTLTQQPWAFDVGAGGARTLALAVELVFRNNDVTQVSAQVEVTDAAAGSSAGARPLASPGERAAEGAVASLLVPLRALGGTTRAASTTTRVQCSIRGGTSPLVLPGADEL